MSKSILISTRPHSRQENKAENIYLQFFDPQFCLEERGARKGEKDKCKCSPVHGKQLPENWFVISQDILIPRVIRATDRSDSDLQPGLQKEVKASPYSSSVCGKLLCLGKSSSHLLSTLQSHLSAKPKNLESISPPASSGCHLQPLTLELGFWNP